jgi:hypothetical protein
MTAPGVKAAAKRLHERAAANAAAHGEHRERHCHWTYTQGGYRSPWFWPTRADAEQASKSLPAPGGPEPEVFAVHGTRCACTKEEIN